MSVSTYGIVLLRPLSGHRRRRRAQSPSAGRAFPPVRTHRCMQRQPSARRETVDRYIDFTIDWNYENAGGALRFGVRAVVSTTMSTSPDTEKLLGASGSASPANANAIRRRTGECVQKKQLSWSWECPGSDPCESWSLACATAPKAAGIAELEAATSGGPTSGWISSCVVPARNMTTYERTATAETILRDMGIRPVKRCEPTDSVGFERVGAKLHAVGDSYARIRPSRSNRPTARSGSAMVASHFTSAATASAAYLPQETDSLMVHPLMPPHAAESV